MLWIVVKHPSSPYYSSLMATEAVSVIEPIKLAATRAKSRAHQVYDAMRQKIRDVFPDDDQEAWRWIGEDFQKHDIDRPDDNFRRWLSEKYESSDEFTQRLVRRMFTIWHAMEKEGFVANNLKLFEHQKALFAWIALSTATGVRDKVANLLARSPYGSGKSLVAGLVVRAFKETQEEMMAEGDDAKNIPTGALLGLRKEHMLQNALGRQFSVLQPPYTVERADVKVYWKNLATMFGQDFTNVFAEPKGKDHPFYKLFLTEDDDELPPAAQRITQCITAMSGGDQKWKAIHASRRKKITDTLEALIDGRIVFVPDAYNVPQPTEPLPREDVALTGEKRFQGDSAHALSESSSYRIKATHRQLALDRSAYSAQANLENPAQFCIAFGSTLTRDPDSMREDIRQEIAVRCRFLAIDEAGRYTPAALGDSISQLSGKWPYMVGFTGSDTGVEGWTERSPVLSVRQMIALNLMKPVAFAGIGDPEHAPQEGSEEAWAAYRANMFQNEKTAKTLGVPQPHELDSVVVAPSQNVREYAHRIIQAHEQEGIPVQVWCFDPDAGNSRWSIVVNGFNAPKKKGDPKRILVAPPSQMSEALHLHAQCYDVLAHMGSYAIDQTRGRLGHIRNMEGGRKEQEKARTYFRVQWFAGAKNEAYIREVAAMMGYELSDENEAWVPLQCMVDKNAYERDTARKGLSKAEPIPDTLAIQKRKKRKREKLNSTPLKATSTFVVEKEKRKAERKAAKGLQEVAQTGRPAFVSTQPSRPAFASAQSVPQKQQMTFTVLEGKKTITIVVGENGMPVNLHDIAGKFGIREYHGLLESKVLQEFRAPNALRGTALAEVVLREAIRLQGVQARRSGQAVSSNGDGSED